MEINSNKLTHLPDSVGRLKCHTFAANSNLLETLTSVAGMPARSAV